MKIPVVISALLFATLSVADTVEKVSDIAYRSGSDCEIQRACRLDLRYPKSVTGFPTVVWFHGGGLVKGSRHFIPISDSRIAQVAVGYRLMKKENSVRGEDCIRDAAAAVAWTLKNIARFGGDSKKVYVSGMSAGGYLTMMVGMDGRYLGEHGFSPLDLAGIAPVSGQATKHFNVRKFSGDTSPQYVPVIDALAPLSHVSANLPPIVSICGQPPYEWKCRAEENRLLIASCSALGHKRAMYVELPFTSHGTVCQPAYAYVEHFVSGRLPLR
jgi:acetyl esterase/lipase